MLKYNKESQNRKVHAWSLQPNFNQDATIQVKIPQNLPLTSETFRYIKSEDKAKLMEIMLYLKQFMLQRKQLS